jgi:hypothetical protein
MQLQNHNAEAAEHRLRAPQQAAIVRALNIHPQKKIAGFCMVAAQNPMVERLGFSTIKGTKPFAAEPVGAIP